MIAWSISVAWGADPAALRGPEIAPTAVVGLHDLSVAVPLPGSGLQVGIAVRTDQGAASASIGRQWTLQERGAWRVRAGVSGGVVIPLVVPSIGVVATPWVSAGPSGKVAFVEGLIAAPLAASAQGGLRAPILAELQGGLHLGPVTAGVRLGLGAIWAPGTDVSVATEGAVMLSYRGSTGRSGSLD